MASEMEVKLEMTSESDEDDDNRRESQSSRDDLSCSDESEIFPGKSSRCRRRRKRQPNFSHDEVKALLRGIREFPHLIPANRTTSNSLLRSWEKVALLVNKSNKTGRSVSAIRNKWSDLKTAVRKRISTSKERKKPFLSNIETKVWRLLSSRADSASGRSVKIPFTQLEPINRHINIDGTRDNSIRDVSEPEVDPPQIDTIEKEELPEPTPGPSRKEVSTEDVLKAVELQNELILVLVDEVKKIIRSLGSRDGENSDPPATFSAGAFYGITD